MSGFQDGRAMLLFQNLVCVLHSRWHIPTILFSRTWVLHPRRRTPSKIFSRARVLYPRWHTPSKMFSRAWALNLRWQTSSTFSEAISTPIFQMTHPNCMAYTSIFARSLYIIETTIFKIYHTHNGLKQFYSSSSL